MKDSTSTAAKALEIAILCIMFGGVWLGVGILVKGLSGDVWWGLLVAGLGFVLSTTFAIHKVLQEFLSVIERDRHN